MYDNKIECRVKQTEVIYGKIPAKANHYQAVGGNSNRRIIKDETIRAYEQSFMCQCRVYKDMQIDSPFMLQVTVYYDTNVCDLDNSLKTLLDCLQYAHAIENDNTCAEISARKIVDRQHPRIMFAIEEIDKPLNLFEAWEKNDMPRMQYPQWRR